jgi:hypothetical protein
MVKTQTPSGRRRGRYNGSHAPKLPRVAWSSLNAMQAAMATDLGYTPAEWDRQVQEPVPRQPTSLAMALVDGTFHVRGVWSRERTTVLTGDRATKREWIGFLKRW